MRQSVICNWIPQSFYSIISIFYAIVCAAAVVNGLVNLKKQLIRLRNLTRDKNYLERLISDCNIFEILDVFEYLVLQ